MTIFDKHSRIYQWLTDSNETQLLLKFPSGLTVLIEKQLPFGVIAKAGKIPERFKDCRNDAALNYFFEERKWIYSEEDLVHFIWKNALIEKDRLSAKASYITRNAEEEHIPNYESDGE